MPGYYVHLAASNKIARKNRSFVCGVEMPDLLKYYVKNYTHDEAKKKYDKLKTKDMPNFSFFEKRARQVEKNNSSDGMHYGKSSNPGILSFWNNLTNSQKNNPFFIGYLWHLLTDLLIYKYLNIDIDAKINDLNSKNANEKKIEELKKIELDKLHSDWDKTNGKIRKLYPDIIIPKEILELNIIKYIENEQTSYIVWDTIKDLINFLKEINPLESNINKVIDVIINFSQNKEVNKEKIYVKKKFKRKEVER